MAKATSGLHQKLGPAIKESNSGHVKRQHPAAYLSYQHHLQHPTGANPRHQNKAVSSDGNTRIAARPGPMQGASSERGRQPALPQDSLRGRKPIYERASPSKQTTVQPGRLMLPSSQMPHALIVPKDEFVDEFPDYEHPIAMVPPEPTSLKHSSMKSGLKKSYYMDPQPLNYFEWHLYEYEISKCDVCALYRLELKLVDGKKNSKEKVANDSVADLHNQMVKLPTEFPPDNKSWHGCCLSSSTQSDPSKWNIRIQMPCRGLDQAQVELVLHLPVANAPPGLGSEAVGPPGAKPNRFCLKRPMLC
ncbi:hypothetical protein KIW84_054531 [Lathyrus oleraceus]|uniref:Uncharacterized protein n=1 Tax=Pisum sativum TaxID=3888 RepID=A0A9D5AIF4_PEA|nr:hypothetical protein KIW84_054531 [Pisum sativum]